MVRKYPSETSHTSTYVPRLSGEYQPGDFRPLYVPHLTAREFRNFDALRTQPEGPRVDKKVHRTVYAGITAVARPKTMAKLQDTPDIRRKAALEPAQAAWPRDLPYGKPRRGRSPSCRDSRASNPPTPGYFLPTHPALRLVGPAPGNCRAACARQRALRK